MPSDSVAIKDLIKWPINPEEDEDMKIYEILRWVYKLVMRGLIISSLEALLKLIGLNFEFFLIEISSIGESS